MQMSQWQNTAPINTGHRTTFQDKSKDQNNQVKYTGGLIGRKNSLIKLKFTSDTPAPEQREVSNTGTECKVFF